MASIKTFTIFIKDGDSRVKGLAGAFIKSVDKKKYRILMTKEQAKSSGQVSLAAGFDDIKKSSFVISIGGDGTMLRSARIFSKYGLPILGVNLGRRGFLTETTITRLPKLLSRIFAGDFFVDERTMLDVSVRRAKKQTEATLALNDVVIGKSGIARVIELEAYINSNFITSYRSDGLIVATPTGSTGHNLSAGGPIIDSTLSAFVLTAICPLSINNRPVVLKGSEQLKIVVSEAPKGMDMMLTADGQLIIPLKTGDEVIVGEAKQKTRFIRFNRYSFFAVLKEKLGWGTHR